MCSPGTWCFMHWHPQASVHKMRAVHAEAGRRHDQGEPRLVFFHGTTLLYMGRNIHVPTFSSKTVLPVCGSPAHVLCYIATCLENAGELALVRAAIKQGPRS